MKTVMPSTSQQETPVWFDAGEDLLFGILTVPRTDPRGVGMIILQGGGQLSTNVNDISVRLCRTMSAYGFHAFRFDYHGAGESGGHSERFHLAEPFTIDLKGAVRFLRARGVKRFVLVGSCFGARTVLAASADIDDLLAVLLICPPVRDYEMGQHTVTRLAVELTTWDFIRRAVKPRTFANLMKAEGRRTYARIARERLRHSAGSGGSVGDQARNAISPRFLEPLRVLAARELPISMVYGEADELFGEFERARSGVLGEVLKSNPNIDVTVIPGAVHGFTSVEVQDQVLDLIAERLALLEAGPRWQTGRA